MSKRRYRHTTWLLAGMVAAMLLGGCAMQRNFQPQTYQVQPGDTLSGIAREHGLDWHKLARWNKISPPFVIHVGQQLSLDPFPPLDYDNIDARQQTAQRQQRQPDAGSTVTPVQQDRSYTVTPMRDGEPRLGTPQSPLDAGLVVNPLDPLDPLDQSEPQDDANTSGQTTVGIAQSKQQPEQQPQQQPQPQQQAVKAPINAAGWRWPLAPAVLSSHTPEVARHGINLFGSEGTTVYAAHAGEVVYSGAGLQGIGQLVIIKHAGEYLSAYGYVRDLQVKEGDKVSAGTPVASMGTGPGSRAELHFEVRHKGNPIDPKSVLPQM